MSNDLSRTDDDAQLAEYANEIRAVGKHSIIEIGKRLIKAKALCGHGRWLPWLEREFGWTDKTAQRMMSVAAKSDKLSNLAVPISALYLLAAQNTDAELIEAIAERSEQGERLSLAEVKEMIAEAEARDAHKEDLVVRGWRDGGPVRRIIHDDDPAEIRASRYGAVDEAEAVHVARVHYVEPPPMRRTVVVPHYVPQDQPAPRTIEDFQRDRNRGRAEALTRHLDGVERNLDEDDAGAIIEALTDEERDQARRVVDKLKAALDEDEMNVEVPDQLN